MGYDRPQRLVFGEVAGDYDRYRPSYPTELFDLLLGRTGATEALDVGAGTGRAAAALARRGLSGHAVEPSAEMAGVARTNLPDSWSIEISDFETCDALGRDDWPLVTCAQAWHWIDHERGVARAAELLRSGGLLAIFWNRPRFRDSPLRSAMDEIYERLTPNMQSSMRDRNHPGKGGTHVDAEHQPSPAGFASVEVVELTWQRTYTTDEWIGLLGTHSDHRVLDDALRTRLHREVRNAIEDHGGSFDLPYRVIALLFART